MMWPRGDPASRLTQRVRPTQDLNPMALGGGLSGFEEFFGVAEGYAGGVAAAEHACEFFDSGGFV